LFAVAIAFTVIPVLSQTSAPAKKPAHEAEVPVLTVCEVMSDLTRLDGKVVIIIGRFGYTDEGSWLDEECGHKVLAAGHEFEPSISLTYALGDFEPPPQMPEHFKWDERLLQEKLKQVKRTTKLRVYKKHNYTDTWMAMFGRLETQLPHRIAYGNGISLSIAGFGHLSGSPAQLVSPQKGSHSLGKK
jgi:hypothetical protein